MRKMITGGIAIIAISAIVAFNVNLSKQSNNLLSSISLKNNVEALATEASSNKVCCQSPYDSVCVSQHGYDVMGTKWNC